MCLPVFARAAFASAALLAATVPLLAQAPKPGAAPPPAAVKPYKAVTVTLPTALNDPSFESFRKQLADAAGKKDRAALGKLVVASGFFWDRENGDGADKKKSGIDNLTAVLGLAKPDSVGWDMINGYSGDPTASPAPDHKGAYCAPADPQFNDKDMQDVVKATNTDVPDWAYTLSNGVEVRSGPQPSSPVIEKLGLHFVRVLPDGNPAATTTTAMKIATPSGKTGYVAADSIAPLGNDQICYVKDAAGWKIGGYIGGGESQ